MAVSSHMVSGQTEDLEVEIPASCNLDFGRWEICINSLYVHLLEPFNSHPIGISTNLVKNNQAGSFVLPPTILTTALLSGKTNSAALFRFEPNWSAITHRSSSLRVNITNFLGNSKFTGKAHFVCLVHFRVKS